jgi:hypothetical protein
MRAKRRTDTHIIAIAGAAIALAVIGLTAFVVVSLRATAPVITAAVLTAVAAVLATIPPIIKAIRGGAS